MNTDKIVNDINNIPDCETLQAYVTGVVNQCNAQLDQIAIRLAKMALLTNPVTFIAAYIAQISDDITTLEGVVSDTTAGLATITAAALAKAESFTECTISI